MNLEKSYILDDEFSTFILKDYDYDAFGRVETFTTTGLDNITTTVTFVYDGLDNITEKTTSINHPQLGNKTLTTINTYDHRGRLEKVDKNYNGEYDELIAEYVYTEEDRIKSKSLGTYCLQTVDYKYTPNGWLKTINGDIVRNPEEEDGPIFHDNFGDLGGAINTEVNIDFNANDLINGKTSILRLTLDVAKVDYGTNETTTQTIQGNLRYKGATANTNFSDNINFNLNGIIDRTDLNNAIRTNLNPYLQDINPTNGDITQNDDYDFTGDIDTYFDEIPPDLEPPVLCNGRDLFHQWYYYDTPNFDLNADPQFNGNIAWTEWITTEGEEELEYAHKKYGFEYDYLDRIKNAVSPSNEYDVNITYEDNIGNIGSINRKGLNPLTSAFEDIDLLTYTYSNGLLTSVSDGGNSELGAKTNNYTYVLNTGNLESTCLLYTSPSPRDRTRSRMPSSA